MMVLHYYDDFRYDEIEISKMVKTDIDKGTSPENLALFFMGIGYEVESHTDTVPKFETIEDFQKYLIMMIDNEVPVMPFANPSKTKDGSYLGQPFYLPTDEVGNLIPFSYRNNNNPAGLFYGINLITNMPIIIDRTDELNANGFVIGTSGSGKSVTTKAEYSFVIVLYRGDSENFTK